jgi:hypothetical protein
MLRLGMIKVGVNIGFAKCVNRLRARGRVGRLFLWLLVGLWVFGVSGCRRSKSPEYTVFARQFGEFQCRADLGYLEDKVDFLVISKWRDPKKQRAVSIIASERGGRNVVVEGRLLVGTKVRNLVESRRLFEVVEGELVGENALTCGWEGVKEYLWESEHEWSRQGLMAFLERRERVPE